MKTHYDLIVVGLGAMGAATLYQAAKRGASVLGIDRFDPPHTHGSTHGETRITRLAVGEGPQYVPLVKRSHDIWRELTAATGQELLYLSGLLTVAPNVSGGGAGHFGDFVELSANVAANYGLPVTRMTAADVRNTYPIYNVSDDYNALLDPNGGVVDCDNAVAVQLQQAQALGATALMNTQVMSVNKTAIGNEVITAQGTFTASKVVNATGSWLKSFIPADRHAYFRITRQVIYWFGVDDPTLFQPDRCPGVIWPGPTDDDYLGGFPMLPNRTPGLKVLTERRVHEYDPDTVNRNVPPEEIEDFVNVVLKDRIQGLQLDNCLHAKVCLYTDTPDDHFIIDTHPDNQNMMVVSPCSGHGFKHSAAIGESLAQWSLDGQSEIDLSAFAWK